MARSCSPTPMRTARARTRSGPTRCASRPRTSGATSPSSARPSTSGSGSLTSSPPARRAMAHAYDDTGYQALRVKALESLLVERGLVASDAVDQIVSAYEEDIG